MPKYLKLIGYVPAGLFIATGLLLAIATTPNMIDNVEYDLVGSCYVTVPFLTGIFFWILLGLGIIIITIRFDLDSAIGAGIFFAICFALFLIFTNTINICSIINPK